MGGCTNKQIISPRRNPSKLQSSVSKSNNQIKDQKLGVYRNPKDENSLLLNHSSLKSCPFLFQKFCNSDGSPQQVSLGFMINQCKIDIESKQIQLDYMTSSKSRIWILYSGIQRVSETGLTLQLKNYKYIQEIIIEKAGNNNKEQNNRNKKIIKCIQKPSDNILVIFEPLLENGQTIFMIYRYQILEGEKQYTLITQTLQWSSLAFRINDIYGAETLFQCNSENELCSVCLTSISECILLPCRHMCICDTCLVQIQKMKPQCPLCRKQYYSVIKYKNGK